MAGHPLRLINPLFCRQPRNTFVDVTGWRFAFEVKYGKLEVTNPSEIGEVKSKIGQPGDYSIQRMFLDFTSKWSRK